MVRPIHACLVCFFFFSPAGMLKEQVDDVQRELVDAKSEMARLLYDRELQNIFMHS